MSALTSARDDTFMDSNSEDESASTTYIKYGELTPPCDVLELQKPRHSKRKADGHPDSTSGVNARISKRRLSRRLVMDEGEKPLDTDGGVQNAGSAATDEMADEGLVGSHSTAAVGHGIPSLQICLQDGSGQCSEGTAPRTRDNLSQHT